MEDRCADGSGDLRAVCARASAVGGRCETNLVVDDDMDGTTHSVVLQSLHLKALVDDALASDRGITMHHDGNNRLAVLGLSTKEVLFGTAATLDEGVDSFEMRWVRHQS